jgi:FtsP/CotA-like multicopper oxidase with cupredoxin domain
MKFSSAAFVPLLVMASLPAAAQAPINWAKGTPLTVTMTNRGFTPARIVMRQGGQYVLRLRNPSDRAHTFSAKQFFAQARVSPRDQGLIPRDEVELKPGRSATLHLVAPTTPSALYTFKSTRIADAAANFKGEIVVR